jgi:hypothetical protein
MDVSCKFEKFPNLYSAIPHNRMAHKNLKYMLSDLQTSSNERVNAGPLRVWRPAVVARPRSSTGAG